MAYAKRLRLRLFIEGVEVPVISAQVQCAPNSPMVASIQVPPLSEGLELPPRCIVHLFFYDYDQDYASLGVTKTGASNPAKAGPTAYEKAQQNAANGAGNLSDEKSKQHADNILMNYQNDRYKLLFAGEIMGFQWTKNPLQRSLVLQCSDFSNYWDYAYQYNNTDLFGPGYKAMFSGGSTNLFTDFLSSPGEIMTRILKTPSVRFPNLKGLMGGIIHVIEAIGGSYYYDKKIAGQNIFFSLAELRLHITQMIHAYDKDMTSSRLLGGSYDGLFGRTIGNLGEQASIRKVISAITGVIFHECYPQPCPYYRPGTDTAVSGTKRSRVQQIPTFGGLAWQAELKQSSLQAISDEIQVASINSEPTKDKIPGWKDRAEAVRKGLMSTSKDVDAAQRATVQQRLPGLTALASKMSAAYKSATSSTGRAVAMLGSYKKASELDKVVGHLQDAIKKLKSIQELEADVTPSSKAIPPILGQQIFRPDVWFSAPPRCNVLFPEHYNQLSYSRMFMSEPTRLLLKTNDEFFGEDELFDKFYFAPKALTLKGEAKTLQAMLRGDILDHEIYTGILPVFEKMGEFNIFAARSGMVQGKTPKVGLAQRSCNFLYFKHRFAPRQLQIAGKFNPYIAVGFPGLIIDQYVNLETIKTYNELVSKLPAEYRGSTREINSMLGTHFLASFYQVTHTVAATGQGATIINCQYARQALESVEFLGAEQTEQTASKKLAGKAYRDTEVGAIFPPKVNGVGPAKGRITAVVDVTDKYKTKDINAPGLPLYNGPVDKRTKEPKVKVPIGVVSEAKNFGKDVVDIVGDPNIIVSFRAYRVSEDVSRGKDERIDLPPEEYIRPGWYGDCWHPAKISEVYYDFFNTGAITEPQQIQHTTGDIVAGQDLTSSDAATTIADALANSNYKNAESNQFVALALAKDACIENAVAYLALTYSVVKQAGFDVEQFINAYTWRPIATMVDMFGTQDLKFSQDGTQVVSGVEGFHSRAFGPFESLFGLVNNDISEVVGIKRGSPQSQKADKRKAKLDAVLRYVARLRLSRGILG